MIKYNKISEEEIRFYRSSDPFGFLSNLFPVSIRFEGKQFRSSEEAYQYGKPKSKELADWIISAPSQKYVAFAGHSVIFSDMILGWNQIKVQRMYHVIKAKFTQHPNLRKLLLETGNKKLVEDSKTDSYWGIGENGNGKNMLGKSLMRVRKELL